MFYSTPAEEPYDESVGYECTSAWKRGRNDYTHFGLPDDFSDVVEWLREHPPEEQPLEIAGHEVEIDPQSGIKVGCYKAKKNDVCSLVSLMERNNISSVTIQADGQDVGVDQETMVELKRRLVSRNQT